MYLGYYLPLEKGERPSFDQTCIPFTLVSFLPILVENGSVVLEKKMKKWKEMDKTDGQRTSSDQKMSLELSA